MQDNEDIPVTGTNGPIGVISRSPDLDAPEGHVRLRLTDGRQVFVPSSVLETKEGRCFIPISGDELRLATRSAIDSTANSDETVIPVIAEHLIVEKRKVPTGGVRVHKIVHEHQEVVSMPLSRDHVDIRRVLIGRDVEAPLPVRTEGDTTIIPVVEEVLVVEKRLRLTEEFHITRRRTEEHNEQKITLQREEAVVERLDAEGRPTREEVPAQTTPQARVPGVITSESRSKPRQLRRNKVIPEDE